MVASPNLYALGKDMFVSGESLRGAVCGNLPQLMYRNLNYFEIQPKYHFTIGSRSHEVTWIPHAFQCSLPRKQGMVQSYLSSLKKGEDLIWWFDIILPIFVI